MDTQHREPGELLAEIARNSQSLSDRRGEHAAALWAVNDFIAGLAGARVEYRDAVEIAPDLRLVIKENDGWGLFIEGPEGCTRAYRGAADEIIAAVRRLPELLAGYSDHLKRVSGSKLTVAIAEQFVKAATVNPAAIETG